jgi:hypothetical protein
VNQVVHLRNNCKIVINYRIKDEIKRCITTYNNQAEISNINVKFLKNNKGFSFDIFVLFDDQEGTLSLTLDEASSFKII